MFGVVVLAARRFWEQNMPHHAAALTYQSLLSLFHALIIAVALLGLLGSTETIDDLERFLEDHGVDDALVASLVAAAQSAIEARGASAVALGVALLVAVWFSSSAFVTATTALNVVLEARDDRSIIGRRLHAIGATLVAILFSVGAVIAVFVGGGLAESVFESIGLGDGGAEVWSLVRLPLAALLAMTGFAWMYYAAPTVSGPRFKWITVGAAVAVVLWLAASLSLFAITSHFASYNATYGAFASAVLLVVWLWLANIALLFGAEINAAGRYGEGMGYPLSEIGASPETAQHEAAKRFSEPPVVVDGAPAES